ncbi:MAG: hypothetical protein Kow0031_36510 [Anaerolineae bacterium]
MTTDTPFDIRLAPMGLTLRLISNSRAVLAAAEASFGRFGPPPAEAPPDLTFRLYRHPLDDGPPTAPVFRREGNLLIQSAGRDNILTAHLPGGEALGYFSPAVLADAPYFRWHFLELALYQMLEARGWMGVHASALVRNGRALLLRAASGGGKSTLALAGARSGQFKALAEDVVWLEPDGGRCWGLPWHFHLLPDAPRLFPELAGQPPRLQTSGEMKLEIEPEQFWPGSTVCRAWPAALVFVARAPGESSRLEVITPAEARRLWPLAQTGLESQLPHHPAHIRRLTGGATYRLYFGDDIDAALALLAGL